MWNVFSLLTLVLISASSHAQMDPSTALLLRGPVAPPSLDTLAETVHEAPRARARRASPHIVITPANDTPTPEPTPTAHFSSPIYTREPAGAESPPEVSREEILSVRLNAGYLALSSQSSNTIRDYAGGGLGLNLGMTLWANSTWGIKGDYLTLISGSVRGDQARHGLDHQEIDAALVYRSALVGPRWVFGLGYHQLSNEVVRTQNGPVGGRSRGADLSVNYHRPANEHYAHIFEGHLQPYLAHDEIGSADRANSGPGGAAFGGSLAVGGLLDLESKRRVFWRLRYTFERDAFTHSPNVDVHQTWLTLGCKWGS